MTSSLPRSAQKDFERAVSLFREGRLAIAEGICGELFARFPGEAELAHFAGVLATRMGKFALAAERLARSVRLEPSRSRAHAALESRGVEIEVVYLAHRASGSSP